MAHHSLPFRSRLVEGSTDLETPAARSPVRNVEIEVERAWMRETMRLQRPAKADTSAWRLGGS